MINFSLYRKEIEMLEITKQLFKEKQYHGGYRESIDELFYENNQHFRPEFLEIIPVENLEATKELLYFLKTVNSSSERGGNEDTIGAAYRGDRKVKDLIEDISKLQELIKTQCNKKYHFGAFYSWQSDTDSKYNRNFIEKALRKSINAVNNWLSDGPYLSLDKDTRGISGSPDIVTTILQKIDRSVCFIADVTPIAENGNKKICNSNVMFELGYALSSLSFERVILICNTAYCELNELPFDLGLKRVIAYKYSIKSSDGDKKTAENKLETSLTDAITATANL